MQLEIGSPLSKYMAFNSCLMCQTSVSSLVKWGKRPTHLKGQIKKKVLRALVHTGRVRCPVSAAGTNTLLCAHPVSYMCSCFAYDITCIGSVLP